MEVLISIKPMIREIEEYAKILRPFNINLSYTKRGKYKLTEKNLIKIAGQFDGVICGDDEWTRAAMLAHTPRLKCIVKWGTGVDSIDLEAAVNHGITVFSTANAFTDAVADHTMAFMGALIRRLPEARRTMVYGLWNSPGGATAYHEKILGIIGLGNIGQAVAKRALAHNMAVLAYDINPNRRYPEVKNVDLGILLIYSDVVTLHCDLNPSSYHMLNESALALMKHDAYLINTARGAIVDQKALIRALGNQALAGYAADVFEEEPACYPFGDIISPVMILTSPHMAHSSPEAHDRVNRLSISKLLIGLGITPEQW